MRARKKVKRVKRNNIGQGAYEDSLFVRKIDALVLLH